MTKSFLLIAGLVLGAAALPTASAASAASVPAWAPPEGAKAKFVYRYYPATDVYFREKDKLWIYLDAGQWRTAAKLPASVKVDPKNYVSLKMDTDKPYTFHTEVKAAYPPGKYGKAPVKENDGKPFDYDDWLTI